MILDDLIDKITETIKYNIYIMYNDEDSLPGIKNFVNSKFNFDDNLPYGMLVYFIEEVLADLINCEHIYTIPNDNN